LIALLVDRASKGELVERVVQAASPKLIGRHLPDVLQETLLSYFEIDFIRPEWEIEYEIARLADHPKVLRVTSRVKGVIKKCSPANKDFTFVTSVDPSFVDPSVGEAGAYNSQILHVSMAPEFGQPIFEHNMTSADSFSKIQSDGSVLFENRVTLTAGGRYTTVSESVEYRPTAYFLPLFTVTTVVRATVRIRYPKDLLEVSLQLPVRDESLPHENTLAGTEWEIRSPILPGQCILAVWNPKLSDKPSVELPQRSVPTLEEARL